MKHEGRGVTRYAFWAGGVLGVTENLLALVYGIGLHRSSILKQIFCFFMRSKV